MDDSRCPQNTAVLYGSTPLTLRDLCRGSCVRVRDFVYMIGVDGCIVCVPLSVSSDSHCKL